MAQQEDFSFDQGTDVAIEIHLVTPDGSKKDLDNYTAACQMRRTANTSDSDAFTFNAIVANPPSNGVVVLSMTNEQTSLIPPHRYMYDVELAHLDSGGNNLIEIVLKGTIEVGPNITRI